MRRHSDAQWIRAQSRRETARRSHALTRAAVVDRGNEHEPRFGRTLRVFPQPADVEFSVNVPLVMESATN